MTKYWCVEINLEKYIKKSIEKNLSKYLSLDQNINQEIEVAWLNLDMSITIMNSNNE